MREAISNAVRHAKATSITVRLAIGDDVVLEIADDGIGIPAEPGRHSGVANIAARTERNTHDRLDEIADAKPEASRVRRDGRVHPVVPPVVRAQVGLLDRATVSANCRSPRPCGASPSPRRPAAAGRAAGGCSRSRPSPARPPCRSTGPPSPRRRPEPRLDLVAR
ncbi:hypothetical protein IU473_27725 [Nocardia farcinica]|nr:hypothetical protein [Nocardia farcinica]